jgi:hypothetical protein
MQRETDCPTAAAFLSESCVAVGDAGSRVTAISHKFRAYGVDGLLRTRGQSGQVTRSSGAGESEGRRSDKGVAVFNGQKEEG